MIERTHPKLSVGAQCRLLSISRSSFYYAPLGETAMNRNGPVGTACLMAG
jgi:putative transposase